MSRTSSVQPLCSTRKTTVGANSSLTGPGPMPTRKQATTTIQSLFPPSLSRRRRVSGCYCETQMTPTLPQHCLRQRSSWRKKLIVPRCTSCFLRPATFHHCEMPGCKCAKTVNSIGTIATTAILMTFSARSAPQSARRPGAIDAVSLKRALRFGVSKEMIWTPQPGSSSIDSSVRRLCGGARYPTSISSFSRRSANHCRTTS